MKKRRNNSRVDWTLISYILTAVIVAGAGVAYAYLIGNSNLPDWVKFWLLK